MQLLLERPEVGLAGAECHPRNSVTKATRFGVVIGLGVDVWALLVHPLAATANSRIENLLLSTLRRIQAIDHPSNVTQNRHRDAQSGSYPMSGLGIWLSGIFFDMPDDG